MKNKMIIRYAVICIAILMAIAPVNASAASILKKGSKGTEVTTLQAKLKGLGFYTYSKNTGYYGTLTELAVKKLQKANGLAPDGVLGTKTRKILAANHVVNTASGKSIRIKAVTLSASTKKKMTVATLSSDNSGALDWFKEVRYIWDRGKNAVVTDVNTGKTFKVKRTYGTNHADVEPLSKQDTATIKDIWGGFGWERRAVIVQIGDYTIAGSMTGMPHAGCDSAAANKYVSNRSAGFGSGVNLDEIKDNGCSGVMDIHFKNSRTHVTDRVESSQQNMVSKAANFIHKLLS